jgi:hypothetical protein
MEQPAEFASLALFPVFDQAAFITGAGYSLGGGFNNLEVWHRCWPAASCQRARASRQACCGNHAFRGKHE